MSKLWHCKICGVDVPNQSHNIAKHAQSDAHAAALKRWSEAREAERRRQEEERQELARIESAVQRHARDGQTGTF